MLFPRYLTYLAVPNRKPIWITETQKQIGRYLIRYTDNQVYDIGMGQCTVKHKQIGHALKQRPCWEG